MLKARHAVFLLPPSPQLDTNRRGSDRCVAIGDRFDFLDSAAAVDDWRRRATRDRDSWTTALRGAVHAGRCLVRANRRRHADVQRLSLRPALYGFRSWQV